MILSNHEIVCRVNHALSNTTIAIVTNPADKPRYLARFATTVNEIMEQRDDTDITDARCDNCGAHLFQPERQDQP